LLACETPKEIIVIHCRVCERVDSAAWISLKCIKLFLIILSRKTK